MFLLEKFKLELNIINFNDESVLENVMYKIIEEEKIKVGSFM